MRGLTALVIAGVAALGALSAELVSAQTTPPRSEGEPETTPQPPAAPPPAPAPGPELPPQETAPPAPSSSAPAEKPSEPGKESGHEAGKDAMEAPDTPPPPAAEPGKRQTYNGAVLQALDKITAETMRFEVKAGQTVRWKGLVFSLRSCETSAPDEPLKDSMAYLTVRSEPQAQSAEAAREIFRGWMFASSPALNPMRHPVYDAWLIACRA